MNTPPMLYHAFIIICIAFNTTIISCILSYSMKDAVSNIPTATVDASLRSMYKQKFETTAQKCEEIPSDIPQALYKSQSEEDKELMKWFGKLCKGSYIEMGGLDGVVYSNSHVFNKALQWKGILVEIVPSNFEKLTVNRPNEIATINAGVCDAPQTLHYHDGGAYGQVAGIYEFSSPSFRKQYWGDASVEGMKEIKCDTLDNLLGVSCANHTFFDFFSLDVEGAELSVLESVNFDRVGFGVVFFEADEHNLAKNLAARTILNSAGYVFLQNFQRSDWYINHDFHSIYKGLIY